jgi:hypothetical protein
VAVTFDAVGPSSSGGGTSGATTSTTASWTHTAGASATAVVVQVAIGNGSSGGVTTTATYGGVSMTSLGQVAANSGTTGYVVMFGLLSPATGAQTVAITVSSASTISGGSVSFTGAGSFGTAATASGSSTAPSVTATGTTSGNVVVDALGTGSGVTSSSQTNRWLKNTNTASSAGCGAGSTAAAGGSVTMAYVVTNDEWGIVAVEVQAGGSGGGGAIYNPCAVTYQTKGQGPATLTTGNATSVAVAYPSGVALGDCLVLCAIHTASSGAITTPSGWTAAKTGSAINSRMSYGVYTKVATSTEVTASASAGTLSVSHTTSSLNAGVMLRYNNVAASPVGSSVAATSASASTTSPTSGGTLSPAPSALDHIVRFYCWAQTTHATGSTLTVPGTTTNVNWNERAHVITACTTSGTFNCGISAADELFDSGNPFDTVALTSNQTGAWAVIDLAIHAATPATPIPGVILDLGATGGQNHFLLQTALEGDANIGSVTEANMAAGYAQTFTTRAVTDSYGVNGVQLAVQVDAPTTDSSANPRTELRELATDGLTNYGFDPSTNTHWLRGRTKLTHRTALKPTVVWAQCHNASSDIIALVTQLNTGTGLIELLIRINGTSASTKKMSTDCEVGDEWDWMIEFTSSGYWAVYYQDLGTPFYDSVAHAIANPTNSITYTGSADCYFKAGCYANTNSSTEGFDNTQYMQVELRYLQHWHTGWTTPDTVVLPKRSQFAPFFGGM